MHFWVNLISFPFNFPFPKHICTWFFMNLGDTSRHFWEGGGVRVHSCIASNVHTTANESLAKGNRRRIRVFSVRLNQLVFNPSLRAQDDNKRLRAVTKIYIVTIIITQIMTRDCFSCPFPPPQPPPSFSSGQNNNNCSCCYFAGKALSTPWRYRYEAHSVESFLSRCPVARLTTRIIHKYIYKQRVCTLCTLCVHIRKHTPNIAL